MHLGHPLGVSSDRVPAVGEADDWIDLAPFSAPREDLGYARSYSSQRDFIPPPPAKQLEILWRNDVGHSAQGRE
jgi:hypothetical protein